MTWICPDKNPFCVDAEVSSSAEEDVALGQTAQGRNLCGFFFLK